MEYLAKKDGRIKSSRFLRISPEVLLLPGAKMTDGVSNKTGVTIGDPVEMMHKLDWEVLYTRTDWKDPAVQARLKTAEKYEVIIPDTIPVQHIRYI